VPAPQLESTIFSLPLQIAINGKIRSALHLKVAHGSCRGARPVQVTIYTSFWHQPDKLTLQSDILTLSRTYRPLSRTYLISAEHIGLSVGHTYPQPNISAAQSDILTLSRTYRPLSRTYLPSAQHIGHAVGHTVFATKTSCMDGPSEAN
jgi:hypothetical protein